MNQVVHVEIPMAAPRQRVFALLAEVESWPEWSSFDEAGLERDGTPERQGVGAVRRFRHGRTRSREEVVAFVAPSHFAYRLLSGLPVRDYRADVTLIDRPDGGTLVTWHSTFRGSWPGSGPLARRSLQKFIARLGRDLAGAAELAEAAVPTPGTGA